MREYSYYRMSNNGMFIVTVFVSDSWGRSVVTFYTEFVGVGSFEVELMFFWRVCFLVFSGVGFISVCGRYYCMRVGLAALIAATFVLALWGTGQFRFIVDVVKFVSCGFF